jgi:hypothetical protein
MLVVKVDTLAARNARWPRRALREVETHDASAARRISHETFSNPVFHSNTPDMSALRCAARRLPSGKGACVALDKPSRASDEIIENRWDDELRFIVHRTIESSTVYLDRTMGAIASRGRQTSVGCDGKKGNGATGQRGKSARASGGCATGRALATFRAFPDYSRLRFLG